MAWADLLGHDLAKHVFQTHLKMGTVPNAYLLAGPDGVGKRRLALEMAKALTCTSEGARPCDHCATCTQIAKGLHPDVHLLVPAGASDQIGIEEIRHLLGRIVLRPFNARCQVAVIDGANRLTEEAANSLLKTLEEPPHHAHFLLVTGQLSHCLPTIVSRCQLIRCHPLPVEAVRQILTASRPCEPHVTEMVCRLCSGSAAKAVELAGRWEHHQQLIARMATLEVTAWIEEGLPQARQEVMQVLDRMVGWLRDLAMTACGSPTGVVHRSHEDAMRRQAATVEADQCVEAAFELIRLRESLEQFVSPRLVAALARETWFSLMHR